MFGSVTGGGSSSTEGVRDRAGAGLRVCLQPRRLDRRGPDRDLHAAGHASAAATASSASSAPPPPNTLYEQFDGAGGTANKAQNYETGYDPYDSEAADDFEVPAGTTWTVNGIDIQGIAAAMD